MIGKKKTIAKPIRKAKTKVKKEVVIPQLRVVSLPVTVIGRKNSKLILHNWDEKSRKQMRDKQQKKTKVKERPIRDPHAEYLGAFYWTDQGRPGIPGVVFKLAMASYAATYVEGMTSKFVKTVFTIPEDVVEIHGNPYMKEDCVRLSGMGNPTDLRYRPYFDEWWIEFHIEFDPQDIPVNDAITLLERAGFHIGVGDFRHEKSGHNYGRFFVAGEKEVKAIKKKIPVTRKKFVIKKKA